jgi:hypothetical protein
MNQGPVYSFVMVFAISMDDTVFCFAARENGERRITPQSRLIEDLVSMASLSAAWAY